MNVPSDIEEESLVVGPFFQSRVVQPVELGLVKWLTRNPMRVEFRERIGWRGRVRGGR